MVHVNELMNASIRVDMGTSHSDVCHGWIHHNFSLNYASWRFLLESCFMEFLLNQLTIKARFLTCQNTVRSLHAAWLLATSFG